jgi:hypothetical protein
MMGGAAPPQQLAVQFQALIGSFVRTGAPDASSGRGWPGYERASEVLHLGLDPRFEQRELGELELHWL